MSHTVEFYQLLNGQFRFVGSTATFKNLSYANRLNDIGACEFSLDINDPGCNTDLIRRFGNNVLVKQDGVPVFVGPIVNFSGTYDSSGGFIDVYCNSYLGHLAARFTDAFQEFTQEEQADIALELIETVQGRSNGSLRIRGSVEVIDGEETTYAVDSTGVARDRQYEYYRVSTALINLSNVINGLDFDFTASLGDFDELDVIEFSTYAEKGTQRSDIPPLKIDVNIVSVSWSSTGQLVNTVSAIGSGLTEETILTSQSENAEFQKSFGRREEILDLPDIRRQDTLDERAAGHIREQVEDKERLRVRLNPGLDYNIQLGDSIKLELSKGFLNIDDWYRVQAIETVLDQEGVARINLTFF